MRHLWKWLVAILMPTLLLRPGRRSDRGQEPRGLRLCLPQFAIIDKKMGLSAYIYVIANILKFLVKVLLILPWRPPESISLCWQSWYFLPLPLIYLWRKLNVIGFLMMMPHPVIINSKRNWEVKVVWNFPSNFHSYSITYRYIKE